MFLFPTPDLGSNSWSDGKPGFCEKEKNSPHMKKKMNISFKNICLVWGDNMFWKSTSQEEKNNNNHLIS